MGQGRKGAIDHTLTQCMRLCVGRGARWSSHTDKLTYRQSANGSALSGFWRREVKFFYCLKFDTINFGHLNKGDAQHQFCVCVCGGGVGGVVGMYLEKVVF